MSWCFKCIHNCLAKWWIVSQIYFVLAVLIFLFVSCGQGHGGQVGINKWRQYWQICCWKLLTRFWSWGQRARCVVSSVSHAKTCCLVLHLFMALWLVTWLLALKEPTSVDMLCIEEFLCASKNYLSEYDTPWTFTQKKCWLCWITVFQEFLVSTSWIIFLDKLDGLTAGFYGCVYTESFYVIGIVLNEN